VLSALPKLKICVAYRLDGQLVKHVPADPEALAQAEPEYEELDGWQTDISGAKALEEMPRAARDYVAAVEAAVGTTVDMVTVGRGRGQIARRTGNG
jgi:adenylosuccinate synthase